MRAIGLSLSLAMACAEAPVEDVLDFVEEEEECEAGFKVGQCPVDFSLPDRDSNMIGYTEYIGQRVAVVGAAGW